MTTADTKDEYIIFMHDTDRILEVPFDGYQPGDIKKTKEKIARALNCGVEEIEVRIIGIMEKEGVPRFQVIEGGAGRKVTK